MLQQIMDRFPGISCAYRDVVGNVTTECYGVADKESNIPTDENTFFPAYSISKFITAICVMKLQEQRFFAGKIRTGDGKACGRFFVDRSRRVCERRGYVNVIRLGRMRTVHDENEL